MPNLRHSISEKKKKKKKKVLVAGGAGFIGSHLCEALLIQGFEVFCLDDFRSGKQKNIAKLENKNFHIIKFSLSREADLSAIEKVDYVFHLAGVDAYLEEKGGNLSSLLVNSQGTKELLEKSLGDKAEFLYLSSVDIYSGVASRLSMDNYFGKTLQENRLYSQYEAKRFGEALVEEFRKAKGLKSRIVRIKDVYGPRMPLNSAYPFNSFFSSFLNGKEIQLKGEGLDELYPTYISDVIYGLVKAMFSVETEGKVYYLVNPKKMTTRSVAEGLLSFRRDAGVIKFVPTEEVSFLKVQVDISTSKRDLRWHPLISFEEGIVKTINWFKKESSLKKEKSLGQIETKVKLSKEDFSYEKTDIIREKKEEKTEDYRGSEVVSSEKKNLLLNHKNNITNRGEKWVKNIFRKRRKKEKENREVVIGKKTPLGIQFSRLKIVFVLMCFLFIVLGFISPFMFSSFFAFKGLNNLESTKKSLLSFSFSEASKSSTTAQKSFRTAGNSLNNLLWLFSLVHERERFQDYVHLLEAGKDVSEGANDLTLGIESIISLFNSFWKEEDFEEYDDFKITISRAKASLIQSEQKLAQAQAKVASLNIDFFPSFMKDKIFVLENQIEEGREALSQIERLSDVLPVLMGGEEDKVYLFVFQNNNELRATGGFIGSYARVLVSQGRIADIKVDDVYNPDGLIENQFTPPDPLTEHLGVTSWGMRDANWSPDFKNSSQDIKNLYEAATRDSISGVIAVDLYTIEKLLEALGPIEPLGYDEQITSDNFFEKAEYYSEVGFTPGSTGKRDFLGACANEVFSKLRNLTIQEFGQVIMSLYTSIEERHVIFSFSNEILQQIIEDRKVGGRILDSDDDYLLVVDSNLGGNKSNYFVNREEGYKVNIDRDGQLKGEVSLKYIHSGKTDSWPGGNYKNFLRVYVPEGSQLIETEGFSSEVGEVDSSGKTVFSGLVEVSIDSTHEVKIMYSLPISLQMDEDNLEYDLYVQKQSGSVGDKFEFEIEWPQYLFLQKAFQQGNSDDQKYSTEGLLNIDKEVRLLFEK